jgi:hypothetical protein
MRAYDRLWIMASFFAIWDLIRYGQTGSDLRLVLAYVLFFVSVSFYCYSMHLDNIGRK